MSNNNTKFTIEQEKGVLYKSCLSKYLRSVIFLFERVKIIERLI